MSTSDAAAPVEIASGEVGRVWATLRAEAVAIVGTEPVLAGALRRKVLERASFADALALTLATKFASADVGEAALHALALDVFSAAPLVTAAAAADLAASVERNPAYRDHVTPFLYAKGFHALEWYRVAHALWGAGREALASAIEGRMNDVFGIDIHPAARIGSPVFIDHGTGIVIGETAVVGDDVSILHGVTLGGTGKETGDRHPKIGRGVLLSAGATVLGNVHIGEGAKIGAASVVLKPVAPYTTVAGVPAKLVGRTRDLPSETMNQNFLDVLDFQI